MVSVRLWVLKDQSKFSNIVPYSVSDQFGAGSSSLYTIDTLFPGDDHNALFPRALVRKPRTPQGNVSTRTDREIVCTFTTYRPVLPSASVNHHASCRNTDWADATASFTTARLADGIMYTDGEWSESSIDAFKYAFRVPDPESIKASSAIVLMSNADSWLADRTTLAIRLVGGADICAKHAFTTELLGINGALRIAARTKGLSIRTDCLSVMKKVNGFHKLRKLSNNPQVELLKVAMRDISLSSAVISHVKGHAGDKLHSS